MMVSEENMFRAQVYWHIYCSSLGGPLKVCIAGEEIKYNGLWLYMGKTDITIKKSRSKSIKSIIVTDK